MVSKYGEVVRTLRRSELEKRLKAISEEVNPDDLTEEERIKRAIEEKRELEIRLDVARLEKIA